VPAVYYGRPDTVEFADQFWLAMEYYNWAWGSPEMNSIGQALLDQGKRINYPHIYQREAREEEDVTEDSKKLGWKTTPLTRKWLISDLVSVIKESAIIIYDIRILEELRVFVYGPDGKPQAQAGEHDDCVITVAGLVQMHRRCPLSYSDELIETKRVKAHRYVIAGQLADDDEELDDPEGFEGMYEDMDEFV